MLDNVHKVALNDKFKKPTMQKKPIINLYKQINEFLKLVEYTDSIKFSA